MFNESYDRIIIRHKDFDRFCDEIYPHSSDMLTTYSTTEFFSDTGIIEIHEYSDDFISMRIQFERKDDRRLRLQVTFVDKDNRFPHMVFPVVGDVGLSRLEFTYDMRSHRIYDKDIEMDFKSEDKLYPTYVLQHLVDTLDKTFILKYDQDKRVACIVLSIIWYASQSPKTVVESHHRHHINRRGVKNKSDMQRFIPLVKNIYIFDLDKNTNISSKVDHHWTPPSYMVHVKGHYRHLKNGKVIWINPFTKYRDKPDTHVKTYKL